VSQVELDARIEAITRSYINKAPGLTSEFQKFAAGSRGQYEDTINYINAQRKSATTGSGAMDKALEKDFIANGVPASWVYGSDEQRQTGIAIVQKRAPMNIAADQWVDISKQATAIANMDTQQQKAAAPTYIASDVRTFDNQMFSILGVSSYADVEPDKNTEQQQLAALSQWKSDKETFFNKTFTHADPAHRDSYMRNMNAKIELVTGMIKGTISAERSQAQIATFTNEAALTFAGEHGEVASLLMGMERAIPGSTTGDSPLSKIITTGVQEVFSRGIKDALLAGKDVNSLDNPYSGRMTDEQITTMLDVNRSVLGKAKGVDSDERDAVVIERGLNTLAGLDTLGVQGKLKQVHYIKIFDIIAQENWSALKNKHPTEVARIEALADGAVTGYLTKAVKSMSNYVARNPAVVKQVYLGVNDAGTLSFIPNTPADKIQANMLNSTYQFGILSKAYSQVKGVPQALTLQTLADRGVLPPFTIKAVEGEE